MSKQELIDKIVAVCLEASEEDAQVFIDRIRKAQASVPEMKEA